MPSEEMIDFLQSCQQAWDGDDFGITIVVPDGDGEGWSEQTGHGGDWVVQYEDGVYRIVANDKVLSENDLNVWAAIFARTNNGHPNPTPHEVELMRKMASHKASVGALVNFACVDLIETDDQYVDFVCEAGGWIDNLHDRDIDYIFRMWPNKKEIWK